MDFKNYIVKNKIKTKPIIKKVMESQVFKKVVERQVFIKPKTTSPAPITSNIHESVKLEKLKIILENITDEQLDKMLAFLSSSGKQKPIVQKPIVQESKSKNKVIEEDVYVPDPNYSPEANRANWILEGVEDVPLLHPTMTVGNNVHKNTGNKVSETASHANMLL